MDDLGFSEITDASQLRGSNNPPADISPIDELRERLAEKHKALITRRDDLHGSVERAPEKIEDEEICGKVADLVKLITACHKGAETTRVGEKEPFLSSSRAVDGFFKGITDPLEKDRKILEGRMTAFQRAKAEAERRKREEEARIAREEAERSRREAEVAATAAQTEDDLDQAITAEQDARQAEADASRAKREAEAKAAELSRSRGDYGAVASLRTVWKGELADRNTLDLEALRQHLPEDGLQRAINAFVRAGGRELKGARIFEDTSTVVR